jgi:hypothetical protein
MDLIMSVAQRRGIHLLRELPAATPMVTELSTRGI